MKGYNTDVVVRTQWHALLAHASFTCSTLILELCTLASKCAHTPAFGYLVSGVFNMLFAQHFASILLSYFFWMVRGSLYKSIFKWDVLYALSA